MDYLQNNHNEKKHSFWMHFLITFSVFIILLFLVYRNKQIQTNDYIKKVFEREIADRSSKLNDIIDGLVLDYQTNMSLAIERQIEELDHIGAMVYLFNNDSLAYWSSNLIDLTEIFNLEENRVILLNNGWYKIERIVKDDFLVYGLLLLKNEFAYRNEYLVPQFESKVALNEMCQISLVPGDLNICDENGVFLFSIIRDNTSEIKSKYALVLFILYQLTIILLLSLIIKFYKYFYLEIRYKRFLIVLILFEYFLIWIILKYLKIPSILFDSYLFSPTTFADSVHQSIGELLTNSTLFLFSAYSLTIFSPEKSEIASTNKLKILSNLAILGILFVGTFYIYEKGIISLLNNSKVSIEFGQDFIYNRAITIIAFIIASCMSLSIYFVGKYIFKNMLSLIKHNSTPYLISLIFIFAYVLLTFFFSEICFASIFFMAILSLAFIVFAQHEKGITTIHVISYLMIFAFYLGFISTKILKEKELDQRRVIVETIANDRDPVAEYNFESIINEIITDSIINMKVEKIGEDNNEFIIIDRIQNHFNQNKNSIKYIPFVTICDHNSLLSDRLESFEINCVDYFEQIIADIGIPTNHPNLFFINNYSINSSYIARISYPASSAEQTHFIYIELGSELVPEGLGYPELLIDESSNVSGKELVSYSFAKYMDGELVYNFGDYFYSLNLQNYQILTKDQKSFNSNGYSHLLFNKDAKVSYIISKENKDLIETIAPFSYFFIFLAVYLVIFYIVTSFTFNVFKVQLSFRNRLQYTLLSIILTSFIVIGVTTMLYLIHLNDKKNHEILSEKAHSVLIELEHKLTGEEDLNPNLYETLNSWLVKFSLVFFSDINLYSTDGKLIASSRMQMFDEGLLSKLMNVNAFDVLANKEKLQFVQNEKIGNYEYLSAYVPLRNTENKLIAYLNLPYFARQTELQIEITTFLVALVNIYVLFFVIAIMVTIVISRRISMPLQLIRQSISGIRLGKSNQKINWARDDEIGGLVAEYNRMIDELSNSARLLVRSEREGAWREMAKQVAHEIKNPLTPMKLSVQYLKKAWDDNEEDWDKRLDRFTKTIIEQIDSLSDIANAFSDFAKMPIQKTEQVDLKDILNNSLELFKENTAVKYVLYLPEDNYIVKADKNQMLRAFNNLIKNSIHAIGSKKDGQITISVKKSKNELIVVFADNGAGIPQEMADKIFSPSFTTKSSGMGLGLAIVKNIVLNAGGNIWFESKANVGTTFYISLPNS